MKLLAIDHLRIHATVEFLAPWSGGPTIRAGTHDNANLLHRTSGREDAPDPRYWTNYDHFMTEYEARVERATYFYGVATRAWQRLAAALSRVAGRVSNRTQTAS